MYRYSQPGQGPPAPFVPASQGKGNQAARSSKAIPIVQPSAVAPDGAVSHTTGGLNPNGGTISVTSPLKAALSAKAASAAVFVPKGVATKSPSAPTDSQETEDQGNVAVPTEMFQDLAMDTQAHHQYVGPESGRGTPSSVQVSGYDAENASNIFDPTYMGPLPDGPGTPGMGNQNFPDSAGNGGRAYNPYEHLNEYGEPTNTSIGMSSSRPGMLGTNVDMYGNASQSSSVTKFRHPLQYHLYNPPMPHVSNLHPQHLSANAFFMSNDEREELQRKNEALHAALPPPELGGPKLPEELHVYHSLVPIEPSALPGLPGYGLIPQLIDPRIVPPTAPGTVNHLSGACGEASRVFGYKCHVYKAQCTLDGKYYVLRRLENFRLTQEAAISLVERWRRIRHPSIVCVREAFTTRAFGDSSIVFVYDYHPLATTLYAEHMVPKAPQPDRRTGRLQTRSIQVHERTLWSYLCQLANIVRAIHHHGLAARCIEPSKVLRTDKNRVRLNCCSIFDVIAYDSNAPASAVQAQQAEDLTHLGRLFVALACNSNSATQNLNKSLEHVSRVYSQDLKSVIVWLLSTPGSTPLPELGKHAEEASDVPSSSKTADDLVRILGPKYSEEFDSTLNQDDLLRAGLSKELENARLVRLLCKFGFINERPEYDHDPRWSETGDRYIVKLFRDYVFHAVDSAGRPVVDLTHILTNLNKLDAGSDEKIMLTSRDEQSCLIVSYRDIKNCIDLAFTDLSRAR